MRLSLNSNVSLNADQQFIVKIMIKNFISILMPGYISYWAKAFDFKGRTKRIDFWATNTMCVIFDLPFRLFTSYALYFWDNQANASMAANFLNLWLGINLIPFMAMAIRRIRDAGDESFWWLALLIPIQFLVSTLIGENNYRDWFTASIYLQFILLWFYIKPSRDSRKLNSENQRP